MADHERLMEFDKLRRENASLRAQAARQAERIVELQRTVSSLRSLCGDAWNQIESFRRSDGSTDRYDTEEVSAQCYAASTTVR